MPCGDYHMLRQHHYCQCCCNQVTYRVVPYYDSKHPYTRYKTILTEDSEVIIRNSGEYSVAWSSSFDDMIAFKNALSEEDHNKMSKHNWVDSSKCHTLYVRPYYGW